MKIEQRELSGFLQIDVQTRRDGNSAGWVAEDDDTEVFFGKLHAHVRMKDLRIEVTMNPDMGDWIDPKWARRKALGAILDPEVVDRVLVALCELNRNIGRINGRKELQLELVELLGIDR